MSGRSVPMPWLVVNVICQLLKRCTESASAYSGRSVAPWIHTTSAPSTRPIAEPPATPLVGRGQELATLQGCYRTAFGDPACVKMILDWSDAEMSQTLGIVPGTVRWRLSRARERLRELLPAWVTHPQKGEG